MTEDNRSYIQSYDNAGLICHECHQQKTKAERTAGRHQYKQKRIKQLDEQYRVIDFTED